MTRVEPIARTVLPPIPRWKVLTGLLVVSVVSATVGIVLWWPATRGLNGAELVSARLDAVKVALGIAVGSGGLFALYLAWRRQRSTEADLDNRERALAHQVQVAADTKAHQERVATSTEADAEAKRITELYTKAVEQLGSDKAPVRLGGLYALLRLANEASGQRQIVIDVFCAYLRMPYIPPAELLGDDGNQLHESHPDVVAASRELEVRLTAQRLITAHLRDTNPVGNELDLPALDIDLRGAYLMHFVLDACAIKSLTCSTARFDGYTNFGRVSVLDRANFSSARFQEDTSFRLMISNWATFTRAIFHGNVSFGRVRFVGYVDFYDSKFKAEADFRDARFDNPGEQGNGELPFSGAEFDQNIPDEVRAYWTPGHNGA